MHDKQGKYFGAKIYELRKAKELTLGKLAEDSGIGLTYLSKIENNKTGNPTIITVEKLAKALAVDENTKQELFRLAKQIPPDLKNKAIKSKAMFEVFRSANGLEEQDLLKLVEEIKKKKKKNAKNI